MFCYRVVRKTKDTSHQLNYDESGAREQDVDESRHKVEIVQVKLSSKTEQGKKDKDPVKSHLGKKKTESKDKFETRDSFVWVVWQRSCGVIDIDAYNWNELQAL